MAILPGAIGATERRANCLMKIYPDGSRDVLCCSRAVFLRPGYEAAPGRSPRLKADELARLNGQLDELAYMDAERAGRALDASGADADNVARAKRRAAGAVRDLARSNDFRYFVTLTLDAAKIDRYDVAAITKRLNGWLRNRVQRYGLLYVLVPELHKDGAVHFHGLINDALPVADSGTLTAQGWKKPRKPRSNAQRAQWLSEGAQTVFNLPSWDYGFTTAIGLYGEREAAIGYVCKYITKSEATQKVGGRWYYSGGQLARPERVYLAEDFDAWAQCGRVFGVPNLGVDMVRVRVSADGTILEQ